MTTLTEQQQEKSLSKGKRKRGEKAPKIVLCSPFPKYWPQLNDEDSHEIEKALSVSLAKNEKKVNVPWKTLIKLPKEVRKERIRLINQNKTVSEAVQLQRKHLKFGLNSVSRAIQHQHISSCLLAGDVQPSSVISHLVTAASTRGIPVLIVPKLKQITSEKLGFSCTALGVSKTDDCGNQHFKSMNNLITRLSLKFPLPMNHAWILRKNKEHVRKNTKSEKKPKFSPGDILIDRLPGLSAEHISYPEEGSALDFISLSSETSREGPAQSTTQLRDDYFNNLLYIAPYFKRMQKNNNKFKRKRSMVKLN